MAGKVRYRATNWATSKLQPSVEIIGQVDMDLARTSRKSGRRGPVGTYISICTYEGEVAY